MCADNWDMLDAAVVCYELGYGRAAAAVRRQGSIFGRENDLPAWIGDVQCRGDENRLEARRYLQQCI